MLINDIIQNGSRQKCTGHGADRSGYPFCVPLGGTKRQERIAPEASAGQAEQLIQYVIQYKAPNLNTQL